MAALGGSAPRVQLLRMVGEGSFGQVFEAIWRDLEASQRRVALKRISGAPYTPLSCPNPAHVLPFKEKGRRQRAEKQKCLPW